MPPKPRQVRIESKSAMAAMAQLESRSDEELEAETRYRAAAQAILGARAAERMDAKRAREHFRVAIASARPQERLQLRRMAEASLALAERRAGDLKLAALFHPDGPNDVAPSGWDWDEFPEGLAPSPLDPDPEPIGFRRRTPPGVH